jgi:hypothetical protein
MRRKMTWKALTTWLAVASSTLAVNCGTRSPSPPSSGGAVSGSNAQEPSTSPALFPPTSFVAQYIREHGLCARDAAAPEASATPAGDERNDAGKPRIWAGKSEMTGGHLPPEVIQYIVRREYGRLRLCYENDLRANPNLQGRVATRFIIERDGTVSHVSTAGSDFPVRYTVACVVRVFETMCFPPIEDGVVAVVYPIAFSPESGDGG